MSGFLVSTVGVVLSSWVTLVLALVIFILLSTTWGRPKNFPPGPPILPFVGSLFSVGKAPKREFLQQLRKYGPISSFSLFNTRVVMVSGVAAIKETFTQMATTGRPSMILNHVRNHILSEGRHTEIGVLGSTGLQWQEQRRFLLRHLRDLGFGKTSTEPLMMQEIMEMIEYLDSFKGEPIVMHRVFNRSIVNVIWSMVMGKRYPYGHAKLTKLLETFIQPADVNLLHPMYFIPGFIRLIARYPMLLSSVMKPIRNVSLFIKDEVKEFQEDYQSQANDCLTAVYLKEIESRKGTLTNFHYDQLAGVIFEMFVAGSETTSSTLTAGVYLLAKHPNIQKRLQKELDTVVGRSTMPSFTHMNQLPYLQATVHEIQRVFNLVPFSLPHVTLQECTIQGYRIPSGTLLLANVEEAMASPELWRNPKEFDPTNFLDDEGHYKKNEAFMPFGSGKRQCAGEPLARLELFLFIACIMHRFTFTLVSHTPTVYNSPMFTGPPVYTVTATPRDTE